MTASGPVDLAVLEELRNGRLHRFAEWRRSLVPPAAAGVYTIWDMGSAAFVYVGMAGRKDPKPNTEYGLVKRLAKHAWGARSGDRFCIYVQDHFILPQLTRQEMEAIAARRLQLDHLVRAHVRQHFGFRFAETPSGREALAIELRLKSGDWPGDRPLLNPDRLPD
jgi:hypothetical protein